ncbi:uncharacterized protein N7483_007430 [Penicillium malachiteum]|uniref:uncharacterized protein n=1 Tax=Penicillium malachiteum TaxID=1324776 RepID=UPI00254773CA|nr:uncharacterized protein N7483_007430 [Penicillium malachiteum]KAJ5726073.1 hypothetical protein N7483_007430 [Penicillium malachiteum]
MTITSPPEAPCFETTKRLLAGLINEGLIHAVIKGSKTDSQRHLHLTNNGSSWENGRILVQATPECLIEDRDGEVLPVIQPSMLCPPVIVISQGVESQTIDAGYGEPVGPRGDLKAFAEFGVQSRSDTNKALRFILLTRERNLDENCSKSEDAELTGLVNFLGKNHDMRASDSPRA